MMNKMNEKMLENVTGGTKDQSKKLSVQLLLYGYGNFLEEKYTGEFVDYARMTSFFESKGYKFLYSKDDSTQNYFVKDGLTYGQDYIEYLIENRAL